MVSENRLKYLLTIFLFFSALYLSAQTPPPGIPAENELFKKGFLDVTLLGADPSGLNLSTEAIQNAVKLARDYNLVCFFPSGTYLVDKTIHCMRKAVYSYGKWRHDTHECVLMGSEINRPVIKLKSGSTDFQSTVKPMPIFWFWSMAAFAQQPACEGTVAAPIMDPECEQSNVNYHQLLKGFELDLGENQGAVGVRMAGAQGATIEDVKINAKGAYAGICNPPGQGGGTYNVEVEGGQYGFYIVKMKGLNQSKYQILSGCTFKNQTNKVFNIDSEHPMVLVGFHIILENGFFNKGLPLNGLSLIDGVIELGRGSLIEGTANNIYMKNVYVKGAYSIANSWIISNPGTWTRIDEYSYCNTSSTNLIDGKVSKSSIQLKTENLNIDPAQMALELKLRHVWDQNSFLHFESPGIVNVKDASKMNGKPAIGNGIADDTEALKYAIEHYDHIFLPKGNYIVSKTLVLQKNTIIIGTGRTYSLINHSATWNPANGNSIIETVDDAEATTTLAFVGVNIMDGHPPNDYYLVQHPIVWRAGQNSMVRSANLGLNITVTGNGGGRWSALYNHKHQFYIDGTSQGLTLYGFNPERAANPQVEIKNARNIKMYYIKSETHSTTEIYPQNAYATTIKMINSSDVSIFGATGLIDLIDQMPMFQIENCSNIQINHVRTIKNASSWLLLKEQKGASVYTIPSNAYLAMYKSGAGLVGATELKDDQLKIYPNPCKDFLQIELPQTVNRSNYKIVDVNGRMMKLGVLTSTDQQIPIDFGKGLYIITVEGGSFVRHTKLFIE